MTAHCELRTSVACVGSLRATRARSRARITTLLLAEFAVRSAQSFSLAPVSCYGPPITSSIRGNWYGGYQAWVSQEVRPERVVAEVERREARPVGAEAWWVVVALVVT
jgi:hypothetical protein